MYKDEKWRSECIKKGLSKAENWDTEVAAGAFYKTALTTMG
jgi:hypothetical protein